MCGPVSLTVFMSQLPELGASAASCVARSAMDRCSKSGLPNVMGMSSSATGAGAELVSGVKSEKRSAVCEKDGTRKQQTAGEDQLCAIERHSHSDKTPVGTTGHVPG